MGRRLTAQEAGLLQTPYCECPDRCAHRREHKGVEHHIQNDGDEQPKRIMHRTPVCRRNEKARRERDVDEPRSQRFVFRTDRSITAAAVNTDATSNAKPIIRVIWC